jgi:hypothetical protein
MFFPSGLHAGVIGILSFGPESVLRLLGSRGILGFCGKGRFFFYNWVFHSRHCASVTGGYPVLQPPLLPGVGHSLRLELNPRRVVLSTPAIGQKLPPSFTPLFSAFQNYLFSTFQKLHWFQNYLFSAFQNYLFSAFQKLHWFQNYLFSAFQNYLFSAFQKLHWFQNYLKFVIPNYLFSAALLS